MQSITMRHGFVDEKAMITTSLISFCHWKTFVSFCFEKKRLENVFLTLTANYCKIIQKKYATKTTLNWLYNDIWCYLDIGYFDWKTDVFQQTVIRVYYIFKFDKYVQNCNFWYFYILDPLKNGFNSLRILKRRDTSLD